MWRIYWTRLANARAAAEIEKMPHIPLEGSGLQYVFAAQVEPTNQVPGLVGQHYQCQENCLENPNFTTARTGTPKLTMSTQRDGSYMKHVYRLVEPDVM